MNPGDRDPARVWTRARPDRSYEARAALGRGEESRAPRRLGCQDRRREACREGPGEVQYEGCRKRRRAGGRRERALMRTRRWKAQVAWALRTGPSESETGRRWP
ncbi:hypothetical protein NDU88_006870 [Pleurodeles waltl]|uniref:Uncharacterized protein n=1 Tax=Pleurodeles waltl TaxID=8319 RepID=A0AAV7VN47_PLEWA|nr:hypothetical protein NDU88_006870 [Pleurodeles waltl]